MIHDSITITLPDWAPSFIAEHLSVYPDLQDRMAFVLALTQKNIDEKTGGPFGAAVFEQESGKLVSIGVNRVVSENISSAHAEVMALSFAQKHLETYDLGGKGMANHQLIVNAQMCAMCLGSVCWSGVRQVIFSATSKEVEDITGFDEGPVPENVKAILASRGIAVTEKYMHEEGVKVLKSYVQQGGLIYNSRQG